MRHGGRRRVHAQMGALFAGILVVGLLVPFAFGDPMDTEPPPRGDEASGAESGASASLGPSPSTTALTSDTTAAEPAPSDQRAAQAAAPPPMPAPPPAQPGPLTASDIGVTATKIRIGIPLIDLGNLSRIGDFGPTDPEGQRRIWQAFVDDINAAGGIHGRQLEPHYRAYDSLSADDQRAACIHFAEDVKVFAVVGGFNLESPHYCLTEEHGIPTITLGTVGVSDDAFARARGRLVSLLQRGGRVMANFANQLHRMGALRGKRIGVTGDDLSDPNGKTVGLLVGALRDLGYEVAHRTRYSSEYGTAASQVPIEVQQMQSKRVDAVLLLSHSLANMQFVQQAESQRFAPAYFTTDWAAQTLDATTSSMPESFDGAIGVTSLRFNDRRVNRPDPPEATACVRAYERRTGTRTPRVDDEGRDATEFGGIMTSCVMSTIFREAATRVGPQLTRDGWSRALQGVGPMPILTARVGPGGFGPRKFDAPDAMRLMRWRFACTCWEPQSDYQRTTH